MIFLHAHGVGTARAVRIFKTYGHEAIKVMTEDPYRLARDVRGIGFRTADAIAAKLGMEKTAPQRLRAGVSFALQTATDEGHCALPVAMLVTLAQKLLEVEAPLIETAIAEELQRGEEVISDTVGAETCVFLKGLHAAERAIAERLIARAEGSPPWPAIDLDKALPWVEGRTGKTLSTSQRDAVKLVLSSTVAVMTGGPGVGKTSTLDTILAHPRCKRRARPPRGSYGPSRQAHDRADRDRGQDHPSPAGDRPQARRLLAQRGQPARLRPARGRRDLDGRCAAHERPHQGHSPGCRRLLLVGDVDQLPSVGPGQVLADIIGSRRLPVARLTEVFRQAAESRIVVNAHRINSGQMPEPTKKGEESDFYFVEIAEPEEGVAKLIEMVRNRIPRRFGLDPLKDIQVLCPMNRGVLGARNLNHELQRILNPNPPAFVERFGWRFSPGDRVMETQNDYDREVFNGDLGMVDRIDEEEGCPRCELRRPGSDLSVRRTRHPGACLRDHDP